MAFRSEGDSAHYVAVVLELVATPPETRCGTCRKRPGRHHYQCCNEVFCTETCLVAHAPELKDEVPARRRR